MANKQPKLGLSSYFISSLELASVEENLGFAEVGFVARASMSFPLQPERKEESTKSASCVCHTLRSTRGLVKTVKYHSQIYACEVSPSGREPNNSYFLKIAYDSFSVCFRLALNSDLYFHILLIH